VIRKLRAENKGAILAYTVEADANEGLGEARPTGEPHQLIVQMIRAIEVVAGFEDSLARETSSASSSGRKTWVAVKLASSPSLSHREMKLMSG
jgi:proline dehydrogenase